MAGAEEPCTPPKKGKKSRRTVELTGLHKAWEGIPEIRKGALKRGSLLRWVSPEKTGVIGFPALKLNVAVVMELIKAYCPTAPPNKTAPVDALKREAARMYKA